MRHGRSPERPELSAPSRGVEPARSGAVSPSISRRAALATGAVALVGTVAACSKMAPGSGASPTPSMTPKPASSLSGTPVAPTTSTSPKDTRPRAPLTGQLISSPAALNHPAVAVKVPNLREEYPQTGLNAADIVFVEPIGDSMTRFMPVFHSHWAQAVNPVRSVRCADIPLLAPMHAVLANTGAVGWVVNYLHHFTDVVEDFNYEGAKGTGGYSIDGSRVYRQGGQTFYDRAVVAHPQAIARAARHLKAAPPVAYLPFATGTDVPSTSKGTPAASVSIPYGPGCTMSYTYDAKSKQYLRTEPWGPHVLADGSRVRTDNVLVLRAHWSMARIFRGSGPLDPVTEIINKSGSFWYLNQGRQVSGTWAKAAVADVFTFRCADGTPLKVAPGRTWLELPQSDAKVVVKTR